MDFSFDTIWDTIMEFLYNIVQIVFGWINLPDFPADLTNSINGFLDLVFDNLSLLGFFIRPTTLKLVVPLLLIVINFELIYKLVMWIVRKLPFVNIK